jgi:FMNH2-dependent dimethyl sulfone monooxygenase
VGRSQAGDDDRRVVSAGRHFAIRDSDLHFDTTLDPANAASRIRETKQLAGAHGHEIQVFTTGTVICRPTRKEAEDYLHNVAIENEDSGAVDRIARLARTGDGTSITPTLSKMARVRLAAAFGGILVVGAPDDVAGEIRRISEAGFDGLAFGMITFIDELPYFAQEVLPCLERFGLRKAWMKSTADNLS